MTRPTLVVRGWQLAYRSAYPFVQAWWRFRKAPYQGVQVALSVGDALLLVRSSYTPKWSFPGGWLSWERKSFGAMPDCLAMFCTCYSPKTFCNCCGDIG